ncbi:MAG: ATP-binding cassette domain-containing protein [Verrucomicrobiota bacterium]
MSSAAATSSETVLRVDGVSKWYDDFRALEEVSFTVAGGQICALLGANGAGKTTLIKIITGLVRPEGGHVTGPATGPGSNAFQHRIWFSYVPEEFGLYERMRVEDVIVYFGQLSGMSRPAVRGELESWLERFKLMPKRREKIIALSKGNQQKVKLICALINRPPLLILDEPFSGLDGEGSAMLRQALLRTREEGTTVLLSSHRLDQMDLLADHVVVISHGRKILDSSLDEARQLYRRNHIELRFARPPAGEVLDGLPGVLSALRDGELGAKLTLGPDADNTRILTALLERGAELENFVRHSPDLTEIFHSANRGENGSEGEAP